MPELHHFAPGEDADEPVPVLHEQRLDALEAVLHAPGIWRQAEADEAEVAAQAERTISAVTLSSPPQSSALSNR